jgi:hypothetical protein
LQQTLTSVLNAVFSSVVLAAAFCQPLPGQMVIKLDPKTVSEFDRYAEGVESQLSERWHDKKNFLSIQDSPADLRRVLSGDLIIRELPQGQPVGVTDGLIHDWLGAVYIPNTTPERVIGILRDFDNHRNIYPEVARSRTISSSGNDVKGFWRLERKGMVPVILEVTQDAHWQQLSPGKWICRAYARQISEVDTTLFFHGRKYPPGEGHGYMWRLYAYWSIEKSDNGVLAECRTLSLSRNIPPGLAWAVGPYVQKMPQDSLSSTLRQTRKAATGRL